MENISHMVDEDPSLAKNRLKQVTDALNKVIADAGLSLKVAVVLGDDLILSMDWHVKGVTTPLPK